MRWPEHGGLLNMVRRKNIHEVLTIGSGHIAVGLAMLLAFLLSSRIAAAQCGVLTTENPPMGVSTKVRLTVMAYGKPLLGATIRVSEAGKAALFTVSTDDHGLAELPPLKPGLYTLVVASGEEILSETRLNATQHPENKTSELSINMKPTGTAQVLGITARMPAGERVKEFRGVVVDMSGAAVPGALIEVYPRDFEPKSKGIQLKAGENGHFSTPLADGTYTVIVRMQAFRIWFQVFEVARDGQAKELHPLLEVDHCP